MQRLPKIVTVDQGGRPVSQLASLVYTGYTNW